MLNYKELGLRIGLEIHRQIETHKLFCECPSLTNTEKVDHTIKRKLKASAGELGGIDIAALYETQKDKIFIYEINKDTTCLVDLDESPPEKLNKEALKVALQVAILTNAKIIDEIQIMRKVIVDGSNISGFQRTTLIAINGSIKTSKGEVKIPTICLEEEAAKKIKQDEKSVIYNLDRLGIPLIEIATDSSIKDPEHAKEIAEYLGMILKSTGKFKSGLGSIRQDVNVSIKDHPRVELKGFQDLRGIPKTIENEINRQLENIKNKKELKAEVRKVEPDFTSTFLRPMPTGSRMYVETDIVLIRITKELLSQIEIPELLTERAINFEKKYKINEQLAREILEESIPFDYYSEKYCLNPSLMAELLVEYPKEIRRRFNVSPEKLSQKDFEFIFKNLQEKRITREAAKEILLDLAQGKHIDLNKYKQINVKEVEIKLKELIIKNKGASFSALMGEAMKTFRGSIDGKKLSDLLKKLLK